MELTTIRDVLARCYKVIWSCKTLEQLAVAQVYINLFWKRAIFLSNKYDLNLGIGSIIRLENAILNREFEILDGK
jgi:hypothetical protein